MDPLRGAKLDWGLEKNSLKRLRLEFPLQSTFWCKEIWQNVVEWVIYSAGTFTLYFANSLLISHSALLRVKRATLISQKNLGLYFFAPYKFFWILANSAFYSIKRITQNQKEFSRGKNVSPKVSKVIDNERENFLGIF